jgi:hypothetical protein
MGLAEGRIQHDFLTNRIPERLARLAEATGAAGPLVEVGL